MQLPSDNYKANGSNGYGFDSIAVYFAHFHKLICFIVKQPCNVVLNTI